MTKQKISRHVIEDIGTTAIIEKSMACYKTADESFRKDVAQAVRDWKRQHHTNARDLSEILSLKAGHSISETTLSNLLKCDESVSMSRVQEIDFLLGAKAYQKFRENKLLNLTQCMLKLFSEYRFSEGLDLYPSRFDDNKCKRIFQRSQEIEYREAACQHEKQWSASVSKLESQFPSDSVQFHHLTLDWTCSLVLHQGRRNVAQEVLNQHSQDRISYDGLELKVMALLGAVMEVENRPTELTSIELMDEVNEIIVEKYPETPENLLKECHLKIEDFQFAAACVKKDGCARKSFFAEVQILLNTGRGGAIVYNLLNQREYSPGMFGAA